MNISVNLIFRPLKRSSASCPSTTSSIELEIGQALRFLMLHTPGYSFQHSQEVNAVVFAVLVLGRIGSTGLA